MGESGYWGEANRESKRDRESVRNEAARERERENENKNENECACAR